MDGFDVLAEAWHGDRHVEVVFPHEPQQHQRKLIEALGGRVVIRPGAPHPGCDTCRPADRSRSTIMTAAIAAHDILAVRNCPVPGCLNEQPCRDHPAATEQLPRRPVNGHAATTTRLEVPAVSRPVCRNHPDRGAPNRGMYAYLCSDCRKDEAARRRAENEKPAGPKPEEPGSYARKVAPLAELAARADAAQAAYLQAEKAMLDAVQALEVALDAAKA